MVHEVWEGANKDSLKQKPSVSTSGKKPEVLGRVLAYYLFMRQENLLVGKQKKWNKNAQFSPSEDARLIEIMTDPTIAPDIKYAFQSGSRSDIDAISGSLVDFTWNAIIAGRYFNNFEEYEPPHRFTDANHVLVAYNANNPNIQRRQGVALKQRFSTIRSRCTVMQTRWKDSGQNDPDLMSEKFCNLSVHLDRSSYYMWLRIREGGMLVSSRLLRLIPTGNDTMKTTRDNTSLMAFMSGQSPPDKHATNTNNGGAIGQAARKTNRSKKRKQGGDDNETMTKIANTLEAIADPKGRLQNRATQLMDSIAKLDDRMSDLLEQIDPEHNTL